VKAEVVRAGIVAQWYKPKRSSIVEEDKKKYLQSVPKLEVFLFSILW
jgi:hypothetical protein